MFCNMFYKKNMNAYNWYEIKHIVLEYIGSRTHHLVRDTEDTIFIVGDFNLPYINWESFDSPEYQIHSVFLDFSLKSGLNQFVNESTLGKNILDLVLSTDKLIVSDLNVTCPFSSGDHNMVF